MVSPPVKGHYHRSPASAAPSQPVDETLREFRRWLPLGPEHCEVIVIGQLEQLRIPVGARYGAEDLDIPGQGLARQRLVGEGLDEEYRDLQFGKHRGGIAGIADPLCPVFLAGAEQLATRRKGAVLDLREMAAHFVDRGLRYRRTGRA